MSDLDFDGAAAAATQTDVAPSSDHDDAPDNLSASDLAVLFQGILGVRDES